MVCGHVRERRGSAPLGLPHYIACGKNVPERIAQTAAGRGCALAGRRDRRDARLTVEDSARLAGFTAGVDKSKILSNGGDGSRRGRRYPRRAFHFSLVRRASTWTSEVLKEYHEELGCTLFGEALLAPTRTHVKAGSGRDGPDRAWKGVSHITGGGFYDRTSPQLKAGN